MIEFTGERYVPSLRGQIYYEHLHRYALAAQFCNGNRVLDIASGEGYGSALLARKAADVVGVDIDERTIEHARAAYYAMNLRFLCGSVTDIPLADASMDVVVSFETIEHVDQHDRMLDEFRRVLVPGGVVVISSPNKLVYSDIPNYSNPYHVKELYFSEFRDLLMRRFRHVAICGQRITASSLIHPLEGETNKLSAWYNGGTDSPLGLPILSDPVYFVAVCSDEPIAHDLPSAYVDPGDDLLDHLCAELNELRAQNRRASAERVPSSLPAAPDGELSQLPGAVVSGDEGASAAIESVRAGFEAQLESLRAEHADEIALLHGGHKAELARMREMFDAEAQQVRSSHETDRAGLEASLNEQGNIVSQLRQEINEVRAEDQRLREALLEAAAESDEVRSSLEATVNEQSKAIAQLQNELSETDVEHKRWKEALLAATAELDQVRVTSEAAVEEQCNLAGRLQNELDDARSEAQRTRRALIDAANEAKQERARTLDLTNRLSALRAASRAFEAERESSNGVLSSLREELRSLTESRDLEQRENRSLREKLRSLTESWDLEQLENRSLREQLERESVALHDLLASNSWKVTAPIRRAMKFVRGPLPDSKGPGE